MHWCHRHWCDCSDFPGGEWYLFLCMRRNRMSTARATKWPPAGHCDRLWANNQKQTSPGWPEGPTSSSGPCPHCPPPWSLINIFHRIPELADPPLASVLLTDGRIIFQSIKHCQTVQVISDVSFHWEHALTLSGMHISIWGPNKILNTVLSCCCEISAKLTMYNSTNWVMWLKWC